MKVVINRCFGGFGLSYEAAMRYAELKGLKLYRWYDETTRKVYGPAKVHEATFWHYSTAPVAVDDHGFIIGELPQTGYWSDSSVERNDPLLVQVVEALGSEAASGHYAKLAVVEIPDGTDYEISEYDGNEHIAEKHRTWG